MNCNTLKQVRQQIYNSFERGADALFNLCDALLCEDQARSLPELSQSPYFERRWPSIYQALRQGRINLAELRQVWIDAFVKERPQTELIWISVDCSSIARPEASTSEDRSIIYVPNMPCAVKPISVGWQFSTVMLLPDEVSSWVAILDQKRVTTQESAIEVGIAQLQALVPSFERPVMVLADRWYATAAFLRACKDLGCQVIIRLKSNRKLYRRASQPTGKKGRPALDGPMFQPKQTETLGKADEQWEGIMPKGKPVQVRRWNHLHVRQDRELEVSVVEVQRETAVNSKRDPRLSWFVLLDEAVCLSQVASIYERRFSHEHGYRYIKQDLFWHQAHVRTPAQFECWSLVVSCVMNQLRLARVLGQAIYRPWERHQRAVTPRQVRRVMKTLLPNVGTPACRCQKRGKSPGRAVGFHPTPAKRYEVVIKSKKTPQKASG